MRVGVLVAVRVGVAETVGVGVLEAAAFTALSALIMPFPETLLGPGFWLGSAVFIIRCMRIAGDIVGFFDSIRAAIAAAWGAAAEVPKNGLKFRVATDTPSAAARSASSNTAGGGKLPALLLSVGLKKILLGPSELKGSTGLVEPPT